MRFARGDAWNLPSEGTGVGFFSGWSVQPKGLVRWHLPVFNTLHACVRIDRDTLVVARSAPPPPPRERLDRVCVAFLGDQVVKPIGRHDAAWRSRRRMAARWRHEQLSVAAALTAARHHSAGLGVVTRREEQQEGGVHEENDALRSQTTPLPGVRPGVLLDPGPPWVEAAAVGHVAAGVPLLGAPSLADSSAEVIDGSTFSFLLQHSLGKSRGRRRRRLWRRRSWSSWLHRSCSGWPSYFGFLCSCFRGNGISTWVSIYQQSCLGAG